MIRALITAAAIAVATPAAAQSTCDTRDNIIRLLGEEYGELPLGRGTAVNPETRELGIIEMWANGQTGTWSMAVTRADGGMCIIIYGQDWGPYESLAPSGPRL